LAGVPAAAAAVAAATPAAAAATPPAAVPPLTAPAAAAAAPKVAGRRLPLVELPGGIICVEGMVRTANVADISSAAVEMPKYILFTYLYFTNGLMLGPELIVQLPLLVLWAEIVSRVHMTMQLLTR
jgi:hypothetical protein